MGLTNSLYTGISGLNTMGNAMNVLGDNTANVNTIAFKASRTTFQDVLSQNVSTAAGSAQVGRGVTLSTVDGLFAQGAFESTSTATDLAIGGQGFFMLRGSESSTADMYTRAGEFRFDNEGYLVNPSGYYVQGWSIDPASDQIQGTIGDINIGTTTPPVATDNIEAIVNLDSTVENEEVSLSLYDAWNGTNAASAIPSEPIDPNNYEYTTSLTTYDSKGASHDIVVYYDRTDNNNEWEFLVTCDPAEDQRYLDPDEQTTYSPNTTYNYEEHEGAGALMYGVINFNTSGDITNIAAWDIPPDGQVDPASSDNRLELQPVDSYYSFETNFTGDTTNQLIELNLGASFSGQASSESQILVSDTGAFDGVDLSNPITSETLWGDVYDSAGNVLLDGDVFAFSGYSNDGTAVSGTYVVDTTEKVEDLLDVLGSTFGGTATINAEGRLKITDNTNGDSSMLVAGFTTTSANGADPFGDQINITTSKTEVISPGRALSTATGAPPAINENTDWSSVYSDTGVLASGVLTFTGSQGDGTAVTVTYDIDAAIASGSSVQDLLDQLEETFDAEASIDSAGRLVLRDHVADSSDYTSSLALTITDYGGGTEILGPVNASFETIAGDSLTDGSREGDVVSSNFETEALSSTQYANSSTTIFQDQNGFAAGFLQSVSVDTEGMITGHYSNGQVLKKAQVALANFYDLNGLQKEGGNLFTETTESGAPITGMPGSNGLGSISSNSLEQSNVDLSNEFVKMITTQRGFQANSKIITTVDEMLQELINIKR